MTAPQPIAVQAVRDYLDLNSDSTSRYTDATIASNIRAAASMLERATSRYFALRSGLAVTISSEGAATVAVPGLRSATSVTQHGSALTVDETYWLIPDFQGTGVYIGVQLRSYGRSDGPAYLNHSDWFDRNLDSPKWPGNWGGGATPNDIVVTGDWGYPAADLPEPFLLACKALAGFLTLRPAALLSGGQQTPDGSVFDMSSWPLEVQDFIRSWRLGGRYIVSVG